MEEFHLSGAVFSVTTTPLNTRMLRTRFPTQCSWVSGSRWRLFWWVSLNSTSSLLKILTYKYLNVFERFLSEVEFLSHLIPLLHFRAKPSAIQLFARFKNLNIKDNASNTYIFGNDMLLLGANYASFWVFTKKKWKSKSILSKRFSCWRSLKNCIILLSMSKSKDKVENIPSVLTVWILSFVFEEMNRWLE